MASGGGPPATTTFSKSNQPCQEGQQRECGSKPENDKMHMLY